MRRHLVVLAALLAVLLSGCAGPTFSSLPLPGSGVSGRTVTVTADFGDALNLAHGAIVKVNGIQAGRVTHIGAHDFHARVTMLVRSSARLHRGATARLRYTTPLGELFVDVDNPARGPLMHSGAVMTRHHTSTAPTVEDALAESSMLVNGGGLGQLETIVTELNKALGGRTGTVRDLLERADSSLGQLNDASSDVDRTLHALDDVSRLLDRRRGVIHAALHDITPAARSIRANLGRITTLLTDLKRFATTANGVVDATRRDILELVRKAGPILAEMASTRRALPATLKAIVSLAHHVNRLVPTDYLNLGSRLDLNHGVLGTGTPISTGNLIGLLPKLSGRTDVGAASSRLAQDVTQGVTQGLLSGLSRLGHRSGGAR